MPLSRRFLVSLLCNGHAATSGPFQWLRLPVREAAALPRLDPLVQRDACQDSALRAYTIFRTFPELLDVSRRPLACVIESVGESAGWSCCQTEIFGFRAEHRRYFWVRFGRLVTREWKQRISFHARVSSSSEYRYTLVDRFRI